MWLDNYYKMAYARSAYAGLQNANSVNISHNPIRNTSGGEILYARVYDYYPQAFTQFPAVDVLSQKQTSVWTWCESRPLLVVGSGTTPVTPSDYCLESEITSLTHDIVVTSYNANDGTTSYRRTMVNKSSESISVSEIGLVGGCYSYTTSTSSSSTWNAVLGYREVLDEPIIVPPGDSFTVTITHKFTMPE